MAQAEFGTIQGHVDGAAPGTQVVAVDTHTGQRSVGKIDAKGNYAILGLRPSTTTVTVAGKAPQTASLQVGQTVAVDFVERARRAAVYRRHRTPDGAATSRRRRSRPTSRLRKSKTCRRILATS